MLHEPTRLSAPGLIGAMRQSRREMVYAWEHQPVGRRPLVSAAPPYTGEAGVWVQSGGGTQRRIAVPRRSAQVNLRSPRSTRKPPSLHWRKGDEVIRGGRSDSSTFSVIDASVSVAQKAATAALAAGPHTVSGGKPSRPMPQATLLPFSMPAVAARHTARHTTSGTAEHGFTASHRWRA